LDPEPRCDRRGGRPSVGRSPSFAPQSQRSRREGRGCRGTWRAQCANCKTDARAARSRPEPSHSPSRSSRRRASRETIEPSTATPPLDGRTPQAIVRAGPRATGWM